MKFLILVSMMVSSVAMAKVSVEQALKSPLGIECYGADNASIVLNAKRTTLKYVVEGETNGAQKISRVKTDDKTYVSYQNSEGWLTFNERGSYYRANGGQDTEAFDCSLIKR